MKRLIFLASTLVICYSALGAGTINGNFEPCPEQAITYTVTGISGASSYDWDVLNGSIQDNNDDESSVTVTWEDTWSGQIEVRVWDSNNNLLTTQPLKKEILIKSLDLITPGSISGKSSVAIGVHTETYSVGMIQYGLLNEEVSSYEWSIPTGWSFSGASSNRSINLVTNDCSGGDIKVRGISACGSKKTPWSSIKTVNRTISQPGSIQGVPSYVTCNNTTAITVSVAAVSGATSYVWTYPSGWSVSGSSTGRTLKLIPNGTNAGTITVKAKGCGLTSTARSSGTISFQSYDPANYPVVSGVDLLCNSSSTTFTLQNAGGAQVSWLLTPSNVFSGIKSGTGTTATVTAASTGGASAGIIYTINNGCSTITVDKFFDVGIPLIPQILPANTQTMAPNTTKRFTVPDIAPQIEWTSTGKPWLYDMEISGIDYADIYCDFTPLATGTFTIKARANYGCGWSGYSQVTVISQQMGPDLTINGLTSSPNGTSVTLSFNVKNQGTTTSSSTTVGYYRSANRVYDPGLDTYLGSSSVNSLGAGLSQAISKSVRMSGTGNYIVIQVDPNNSVSEIDETNNTASVIAAIQDFLANTKSVKAFPVPFTNSLKVELADETQSIIKLVNVATGETVIDQEGFNSIEDIKTDQLPKGIYLLIVETNGSKTSRMIFK